MEKFLLELMADMRLAGCQHRDFRFQEYKDPRDNRLFAGQSNGSVSFQLAQQKVSEGKVPVFIVLYIDGTYLKKGILIQPVYHKCMYIIPDIVCDVIPDIIPDITYRLFGQSVVSTMTDRLCPSGVLWHFYPS